MIIILAHDDSIKAVLSPATKARAALVLQLRHPSVQPREVTVLKSRWGLRIVQGRVYALSAIEDIISNFDTVEDANDSIVRTAL